MQQATSYSPSLRKCYRQKSNKKTSPKTVNIKQQQKYDRFLLNSISLLIQFFSSSDDHDSDDSDGISDAEGSEDESQSEKEEWSDSDSSDSQGGLESEDECASECPNM